MITYIILFNILSCIDFNFALKYLMHEMMISMSAYGNYILDAIKH